MPSPERDALAYLRPRRTSPWRWSDDGLAVVWADGQTIAFREEVLQVLERLAPGGLPPFGAVVLLMAACRDGWPADGAHHTTLNDEGVELHRRHVIDLDAAIVHGANLLTEAPAGNGAAAPLPVFLVMHQKLQATLAQVVSGLDSVGSLPPELRQPIQAKMTLAEIVFECSAPRLGADASVRVVEAFAAGVVRESLLEHDDSGTHHSDFASELEVLAAGLPRVSAERLKLRRRTGLDELIKPAQLELPPVQRIRSLILQLRSDPDLAELAKLAQRIMAAVHVPRALSDPERLPLGGVSDLTNRGPLDRLLISELAHDDMTLATRIALNEALYLRRESPASAPPPMRALLIDVGVRLWGIPRLFAAAAALGLGATADPRAQVAVYRARGDAVDEVDLTTQAGLTAHLETLQPHAHPGAAIRPFLSALQRDAKAVAIEAILLTHEDALADPDLLKAIREAGSIDWHVATVTRSGAFRLYHLASAARTLVCQAELSLQQIAAAPRQSSVGPPLRRPGTDPSLPLILSVEPFPLLLPHYVDSRRAVASSRHGLLAATLDGRLLQWTGRLKGARQLTDRLPVGSLSGIFVDDEQQRCHVLIWHDNAMEIITADLLSGNCTQQQVNTNHPLAVDYRNGVFLLMQKTTCVGIHSTTAARLVAPKPPSQLWWMNGRFYRDWSGSGLAVTFDGSSLAWQHVTHQPCLALFDREGHGPWMLLPDGDVGEVSGQRFSAARSFSPAGLSFIGASADGHRIGIRVKGRYSTEYGLDLEKMPPEWKARPRLADLFLGDALNHSTQSGLQPHLRFRGIGMRQRQEILLYGSKRLLGIALDGKGELALVDRGPSSRADMMPFRACKAPPQTRYRLKVATWQDGSRAYLDSRGMLHLKSSDPAVPEVALALTNRTVAGWSSEGLTCGWAFFFEAAPSAQAAYFQNVIREFLARLR